MSIFSLEDVQVAYQDTGQGTPLVLAHCSCASSKEWSFLNSALAKEYRLLAPDLLGYGKSSAWPLADVVPRASDVDVIEAMIEKAGAPVHLIGHSYGGSVCLEVARRHAQRGSDSIRSLFLIEPVAFYLLNSPSHEQDWQEISRLGRRCIAACASGQTKKAARIFMSYWIGALKWHLSPRRLRVEVTRTIPKVAHEFREMFKYPYSAVDYSAIHCPVTLVYGARSRRPAIAVIEVLQAVLAKVEVAKIPAAGHMSPYTHKQTVTGLLQAHLHKLTKAGLA
jgi:pimeloyl-ACP methyl ester carboxylesterase